MKENGKRKILVVEDNEDLLDLLCMILESEVDHLLITAGSGNQAKALLESVHSIDQFDLIISDFNMPNGNGVELYQYAKSKNPNISFAFISGEILEENPTYQEIAARDSLIGRIDKPFQESNLIDIVKKLLSSSGQNRDHFYRFRLSRLLSYCPFNLDLYLDISEGKRLKLFNQEDPISEDDLKKYISKGIEYIYVPAEQAKIFLESATKKLIRLMSIDEANIDRSLEKQNQVLGLVHEMVINVGINPYLAQITKHAIEKTLSLVNSKESLKEMMVHFLRTGDYLIGHSLFASYMACHLADQIGWKLHNMPLKMAYAGILHDMSFANDELAKIKVLSDKAFLALHSSEQEEVKNHPIEGARILESIDPSHIDAYNAIIEHHEKPDGSGFPKGLNASSISMFGALFSIAHEIADQLFIGRDKKDVLFDLNKSSEYYSVGNFKKPYLEAVKFLSSN